VIAVEKSLSLPIVNPTTGGTSRTFRYGAKVDLVDGDTLVDWKIVGSVADFIAQQEVSFQAELYAQALAHVGVKINKIQYRLITRPSIRFTEGKTTYRIKKKGRKTAVMSSMQRDKVRAKFDQLNGYKGDIYTMVQDKTGDGDLQTYVGRCDKWIAAQDHGVYEHEYHITDVKLRGSKHFLWNNTKRVLDNRQNRRWLPNCKACFHWGSKCEYHELCATALNGGDVQWVIDESYERLPGPHQELGDDVDKNTLTHTGMSTLNLCESMYFWRYERALRRRGFADNEAMTVGSAAHAGLEMLGKGSTKEDVFGEIQAMFPAFEGEHYAKQMTRAGKSIACCFAAWDRWPMERSESDD
jgi:hypothetical protein